MRGFCALLALLPSVALADAWAAFEARCLDPFEHQAEPIVEGLQAHPVDQMHEARLVYGPTPEGYLLVLDAAPSDGERSCAVQVPGADSMASAYFSWVDQMTAQHR